MNYRHIYHAGNIGDVLRHVILTELMLALQAKEKGFCYIDTHAGIADYDLTSTLARKTEEYKQGIQPLFKLASPPACLQTYLNLVKAFFHWRVCNLVADQRKTLSRFLSTIKTNPQC
jgi:23S rRNA (adenine2030-N6)-methyltransferase